MMGKHEAAREVPETIISKVAMDSIVIDEDSRVRENKSDTVEEYRQVYADGGQMPPVVVFDDGSASLWLADGSHRLEARKLAGFIDIDAEVRKGSKREAILAACGANARHGLKLTNAEKRRAVELLLRDDEWNKWSNNSIARACGVSPPTVATTRKLVTESSFGESRPGAAAGPVGVKYKTKHGTLAVMKPPSRRLASDAGAAPVAEARSDHPTPPADTGDKAAIGSTDGPSRGVAPAPVADGPTAPVDDQPRHPTAPAVASSLTLPAPLVDGTATADVDLAALRDFFADHLGRVRIAYVFDFGGKARVEMTIVSPT